MKILEIIQIILTIVIYSTLAWFLYPLVSPRAAFAIAIGYFASINAILGTILWIHIKRYNQFIKEYGTIHSNPLGKMFSSIFSGVFKGFSTGMEKLELEVLQEELEKAIEEEDYNRAASIRSQIEKEKQKGGQS